MVCDLGSLALRVASRRKCLYWGVDIGHCGSFLSQLHLSRNFEVLEGNRTRMVVVRHDKTRVWPSLIDLSDECRVVSCCTLWD